MDLDNATFFARNHAQDANVELTHAAIWRESGTVYVNDVGGGNNSYRVVARKQPENQVRGEVAAISFAEFVHSRQLSRISILKVDIEGSEADLLESAWRQMFHLTELIVMEIHDWIPGVTDRVAAVLEQARKEFDFSMESLGEFVLIRPVPIGQALGPLGAVNA
jgi:FkbM family methyltransferase